MSAAGSRKKAALASQAWRLMFDVMMASAGTRERKLAERGLTANDARALWSLSTEGRQPIGQLAQRWECDPSNATFIVTRLQRAGLVDRTDSPEDRRLKLVGLTTKGRRVMTELMREYRIPPPELVSLDAADLQALVEIFAKVRPADAAADKRR
jgi:DNA-binding MarR family transcriptional regulator